MNQTVANLAYLDKSPRQALLCSALAFVMGGCQAVPRAEVDASRMIGKATGLPAPVEFAAVGPDGGPLDESSASTSTLTLTEVVRRAVTTDPSLQAALARIRTAIADAEQARLLPNPVLNVALRWGPGKSQIEASLAQDFIQALQSPRRASAADNRLRQTAADAVTVALDVVSEVQERYASAQASAEVVPILRQRLELLARLSAIAQSRLDAGEGTRGDVATLDAQRIELEVEIDQATLAEREDRVRLARLIEEPSAAATWALESWVGTTLEQQTESRWIEAALVQRPEVQAIRWRLSALGDQAALAGLSPWEGAGAGIDASRDNRWFAGPSVSSPIPIFDMGQARRGRVTGEQLEARHELTLIRREIVEEVRRAFLALAASNAILARIRSELIPLQEHRRALAESAYRAGQTDVTALFLAEQDVRLAQVKAIEVERHAATSLVRLQRAVGGPGVAARLPSDASEERPHSPLLDQTDSHDPLTHTPEQPAATRTSNEVARSKQP